MADFLIPAIGCAAVLVIAALSHMSDLRKCAILFVVGWLFYSAAWLPKNPTWFLNAPVQMIWLGTGAIVTADEIWAAADVIIGTTILRIAGSKWWGAMIFALYVMEVILHSVHAYGWDFRSYAEALNVAFWMQVALFVLAGGSHVVSFIPRLFDGGGRGGLRAGNAMACAKTEETPWP